MLVRDKDLFRQACSNVDGQDVIAHHGEPNNAIVAIRDWLRAEMPDRAAALPSGPAILERFAAFRMELPVLCAEFGLTPDGLTFTDTCDVVSKWLIMDEATRR